MSVATKKIELIKWLSSVEDKTIINQLDTFRKQHNSFDFKKELETAISADELKKRGSELKFDIISNPEFLKEGNACADFMTPDRVIIGSEQPASIEVMKELYEPFIRSREVFIIMDVKSAELTKYAANAMLATKISFINEIVL